ncbi:succinate dehydrogenase/fumarate reductase cytochrome b subunit [Bacillus fengqiuensis]|nr:succinate dehydrogenase/fumarate reductase cytochrome b subunit [Bacillus fengqiuensis]
MAGMIFGLVALSILLLFGMFNAIRVVQKTASYPPKHILKKRAAMFGISALVILLLALILYYVT